MQPKVSVILPFYEGLRWLQRSVASVLQQTEKAWELIVVDDGSAKGPESLLRSVGDPRIRWFKINHAGKGAALNHGVGQARAETVCFLDQDDIMLPGRLETQLPVFKRDDPVDVVYSDYERRYDDGRLIDRFISHQVAPQEAIHQMAIGRSPLTMQTIMIRKLFYEELGGFSGNLELTGLDDLEFFVRVSLAQPVMVYTPGVVQSWMLHEHNYSKTRDFQRARLQGLTRLAELARLHPMLEKELKNFQFHAHCMRGMYFLEAGCAAYAVVDLFKALRLKPFSLNTGYLLIKSLILTAAQRSV